MSDPKSSYGEPVDEPTPVDDVVGRAEEGLADAEAAGRDAVGDEPARRARRRSRQPTSRVEPSPCRAEPAARRARRRTTPTTRSRVHHRRRLPGRLRHATPPRPWSVAPVVTPERARRRDAASSRPSSSAAAPRRAAADLRAGARGAAPARQPRRRRRDRPARRAVVRRPLPRGVARVRRCSPATSRPTNVGEVALGALGTWSLWVTVVVFFLAFWLLGAIINRGRWGAWVIFGLLVGFAVVRRAPPRSALPGAVLDAHRRARARSSSRISCYAPLAIAAFVIGRELTIWFGAWAAARGKRVTELNLEAQREYERTLEAGPQLVRQ